MQQDFPQQTVIVSPIVSPTKDEVFGALGEDEQSREKRHLIETGNGEEGRSLILEGDPEQQVAYAIKAAEALMSVINRKQNPVKIGTEQYLEFEDWQILAQFYGASVIVEWTRPLVNEQGETWGYEARSIVQRRGQTISSAEAMCTNKEEKWGDRPKYEWKEVKDQNGQLIWEFSQKFQKNMPRKERVQIGVDSTPEFQLRSMAQTRSSAKALRNALAWVAVMGGLKPTPAEEMNGYTPYREPEVDILPPVAPTRPTAPTHRPLRPLPPPQEAVVDYYDGYPPEAPRENPSYLAKGLDQANSRPPRALDPSLSPAERFPLAQLNCQQCGNPITQKVNDFSKSRYGKALCYESCQKINAPLRK